jgi:hypothetical protein
MSEKRLSQETSGFNPEGGQWTYGDLGDKAGDGAVVGGGIPGMSEEMVQQAQELMAQHPEMVHMLNAMPADQLAASVQTMNNMPQEQNGLPAWDVKMGIPPQMLALAKGKTPAELRTMLQAMLKMDGGVPAAAAAAGDGGGGSGGSGGAAVEAEAEAGGEVPDAYPEAIEGMATTYFISSSESPPSPQKVTAGATVTVHATGSVATGKMLKKFWSTKDAGQKPFTYPTGALPHF